MKHFQFQEIFVQLSVLLFHEILETIFDETNAIQQKILHTIFGEIFAKPTATKNFTKIW